MSDGISASELNEAPKKSEEIKEKPEAQPELREAAEAVEKATLKPEEKVEAEGDFKESEDLEAAFTTAVDAVPARSEEISATPITLPKEDPDGVRNPAKEVETESVESQARVLPIAGSSEPAPVMGDLGELGGPDARNEVSATPITLPKEDPDGIPDPASEVSATPITLPKEDPDGIPDPASEVSATPITLPKEDPDGIQTAASASAADQVNLDGKGGDDPELVLVDADGESDEPQIDWGDETYDQAGDIRQPSQDGGGPGSRNVGREPGPRVEGQVWETWHAAGIDLPAGQELYLI